MRKEFRHKLHFEATGKKFGLYEEVKWWAFDVKMKFMIARANHNERVRKKRMRASWLSPHYPIEKVMLLSAETEGLVPDFSRRNDSSHIERFVFKSSYKVVAAAILNEGEQELAACIEMEFISHGGGLPPNLVRVIEHLRRERQENSHG